MLEWIQALTPIIQSLLAASHAAGAAGLPPPSSDAIVSALMVKAQADIAANQAWIKAHHPAAPPSA
jgi:hypothetical protein